MSVFDEVIEKIKKLGYWEQVEIKNNGQGIHLCMRMIEQDISKLESQGKIYCGESSFIEILTSGKFLRLCPNEDYKIDSADGKHIDFSKIKTIALDDFMTITTKSDRVLKVSRQRERKRIESLDIDIESFKIMKSFDTEEKNLLYSYIMSRKIEYSEGVKIISGLGALQYEDVYQSVIGSIKRKYKLESLYYKSLKDKPYYTTYMEILTSALKNSKNKKSIKGDFLSSEDIKNVLVRDFKKFLVVSPTGTGKTFAFLNAANDLGLKVIFTVPNVAVVNQFGNKYSFVSIAHSNISFESAFRKSNLVVCTIDKFASCPEHIDLSEYVIINDERHTHVTNADFRTGAIHNCDINSSRALKVIDVTATPEPLYKPAYDDYQVFTKSDAIKYNIEIKVTNRRTDTFLRLLDETRSENRLVLNNDIGFNETYAETNDSYMALDSSKKSSDAYKHIMNESFIPQGVTTLFTTDLFSAGLNIENQGEWHVIINGFKDPTTIKQFVARFRKVKKIKVTIICKSPDEGREIELEKFTDFVFKKALEKQIELNENLEAVTVKEKGLLQDEVFVLNEETGKYELVKDKIYNDAWKYHIKNLRVEDMLICFDEESYTVIVDLCNELEGQHEDFLESVKGNKEMRKAAKELKLEKTLDVLEQYQELSIRLKDDIHYCENTIKKYLMLIIDYDLTHDLAMKFCRDEDFDYMVRYRIMSKLSKKKKAKEVLRKNKIYNISVYTYNLKVGTEINITNLAKEKKFKRLDLKRCIESLWDTQEVRDKKSRNTLLLGRRNDKIITKNEQHELLLSGYILDQKTAKKLR